MMKPYKDGFKLIIIMMLSLMSMSILANELPILKLETAIKSAINTDGTLEVYEKQLYAAKERLLNTFNMPVTTYTSNQLTKQDYEQTIPYRKDALTYEVTKLYDDIVTIQKKIAFYPMQLEMEERNFKQAQIKHNKGLMSRLEYELAQSKLESQKNSLIDLEARLEESKVKFQSLTKYNVKNYKLEANEEIEFYTYRGNVQRYFEESVDQMLKYKKEMAQLEDDNVFYDMVNRGDYSTSTYYTGKANSANTLNNIEVTKQQRISVLNTAYANLVSTEKSIKETEITLSEMNKSLRSLEIQYEKGVVSELIVKKQEQEMENLKLSLLEAKMSYRALVEMIKKPWVNFY